MSIISFEKLRRQCWDASEIIPEYRPTWLQYNHTFSFDFTELTFRRAWEELNKVRVFVIDIKGKYSELIVENKCLDDLISIINESFIKLSSIMYPEHFTPAEDERSFLL